MPEIMDNVTVDGTVTADGFSGPLTGTASRATADASGNTITTTYATKTEVAAKQDALVSGTNIKTINNESLLGSGNITISGGLSGTIGTDTKPIKIVDGQAVAVTNDLVTINTTQDITGFKSFKNGINVHKTYPCVDLVTPDRAYDTTGSGMAYLPFRYCTSEGQPFGLVEGRIGAGDGWRNNEIGLAVNTKTSQSANDSWQNVVVAGHRFADNTTWCDINASDIHIKSGPLVLEGWHTDWDGNVALSRSRNQWIYALNFTTITDYNYHEFNAWIPSWASEIMVVGYSNSHYTSTIIPKGLAANRSWRLVSDDGINNAYGLGFYFSLHSDGRVMGITLDEVARCELKEVLWR